MTNYSKNGKMLAFVISGLIFSCVSCGSKPESNEATPNKVNQEVEQTEQPQKQEQTEQPQKQEQTEQPQKQEQTEQPQKQEQTAQNRKQGQIAQAPRQPAKVAKRVVYKLVFTMQSNIVISNVREISPGRFTYNWQHRCGVCGSIGNTTHTGTASGWNGGFSQSFSCFNCFTAKRPNHNSGPAHMTRVSYSITKKEF